MRLTFLRHAESEFNVDSASTVIDCDLTALGVTQAAALTGHWDVVLYSPLMRAQQTLAHSQITYDRGMVCYAVREQCVDPCDFLDGEDPTEVESDDELADRVDRFLQHLHQLELSPSTRLLVVSHCEFIHAVTGESPQNACFVTLDIPDCYLQPPNRSRGTHTG